MASITIASNYKVEYGLSISVFKFDLIPEVNLAVGTVCRKIFWPSCSTRNAILFSFCTVSLLRLTKICVNQLPLAHTYINIMKRMIIYFAHTKKITSQRVGRFITNNIDY